MKVFGLLVGDLFFVEHVPGFQHAVSAQEEGRVTDRQGHEEDVGGFGHPLAYKYHHAGYVAEETCVEEN